MEEVPRINELKEDDSKFIQVYINGEAYLRYAHKSYHGWILRDLLDSMKIKFKTFRDKSLSEDIPFGKGENYEVVGAGKAYHLSEDILKFYDFSGSYKVGTNLRHLEDVFRNKNVKINKVDNTRDNFIVNLNNSEIDSEIELKSNFRESDEVPF